MGYPGHATLDLKQQFETFKQQDATRQELADGLIDQVADLEARIYRAQSDLEDQNEIRAKWKQRAEKAEDAQARNQFVLVLIDGDGYIFQSKFLQNRESGGAAAAQQLLSDVKVYVKESLGMSAEYEVMVNVYANKKGLAKTLSEAGYISTESDLENFFCKFNQSHPLLHFLDCGYGKESADAKLRDTYRFFAYNSHCRYILLGCCHDNGYIAELKKYSHDPVVAPKTCLIKASQPAQGFQTLSLPVATLESVFESRPIQSKPTHAPAPASTSYATVMAPPPKETVSIPIRTVQYPVRGSSSNSSVSPDVSPSGDPQGIPINRGGQRVDRRMRQPSTQEQERFDARVAYRKLCNEHHLRDACKQYYCKYDHDDIDKEMENTLRYKARSIACLNGMRCRQADCYAGHHCPWPECWNKQCAFLKRGLHDVTDTTIAKFVPAET